MTRVLAAIGLLVASIGFGQVPPEFNPVLSGVGRPCPGKAEPGGPLELYAFGLGPTDPSVPSDILAPPPPPFAETLTKPTVTIGGLKADVLSSVRTWFGPPGYYRVTIRIPARTPPGVQPVVLTIGGKSSSLPFGLSIDPPFENLSAANFYAKTAAPESLVTSVSCATQLANTTLPGDSHNPPTELGGTIVRIKDAAGVERPALLDYVSPLQLNYVVPADTAIGNAVVTIASGDGNEWTSPLEVKRVAPFLFIMNEEGFLTALVVRLRDGVQSVETTFDVVNGRQVPKPIDLGPETDQVWLVAFATGLRARSSLDNVHVDIGGVDAPVEFASPQGEFAGVDQIKVKLPRQFPGRNSNAWLTIRVDGEVDSAFLNFR